MQQRRLEDLVARGLLRGLDVRMGVCVPLLVVVVGCGARTGLGTGGASLRDGGSVGEADLDAPSGVDASVAAALDGLRWELPCTQGVADPTVCKTLPSASTSATMGGEPGTTYEVTLRFRGVVEISLYEGGTASGYWQVGGAPPAGSTINVYGLVVSSPAQTYYVNQGISNRVAVAIDYTETIPIDAGATVTLLADSRDAFELRNLDGSGQPIVVPGVAPAPLPFDGQFVQMDVVSIAKP
jgi:hypothetical protein